MPPTPSSNAAALPRLPSHLDAGTAQMILPCEDITANLDFFIDGLGFRVVSIFPADAPRSAVIAGHGLRLRLMSSPASAASMCVELPCAELPADGVREWQAPNGACVRLVAAHPVMPLPATRSSLVVQHADGDGHWHVGRAGLRYRDLIPDRHGGAYIASHIRLLAGGPVPDYVHFHHVRFQTIFCRKGWVRVVYEDQGPPFVMHAGDCVLQPPTIRHRVLESSAGAEVVEVSSPAEHITYADPDMALPTDTLRPDRLYQGQRFVRHVAATAPWAPWGVEGFEYRDTGIGDATQGLAGVRVVRALPAAARGGAVQGPRQHAADFCFYFVLAGRAQLEIAGALHALAIDDSISIPPATAYRWVSASDQLELLEVVLPAGARCEPA